MLGIALTIGGILISEGAWLLLPNNGEVTRGSSSNPFVGGVIQPHFTAIDYLGQAIAIAGILLLVVTVALRLVRRRRHQ
ncbi:hypothetical protein GCM10022287_29580 [Gryllotalpicola koreensis]|uniref:Uncharacterized protein n=1 Tax=Gryllotalpicola koreensis TaxID=993086 RepID=A0ABP8A6B6_9MICO